MLAAAVTSANSGACVGGRFRRLAGERDRRAEQGQGHERAASDQSVPVISRCAGRRAARGPPQRAVRRPFPPAPRSRRPASYAPLPNRHLGHRPVGRAVVRFHIKCLLQRRGGGRQTALLQPQQSGFQREIEIDVLLRVARRCRVGGLGRGEQQFLRRPGGKVLETVGTGQLDVDVGSRGVDFERRVEDRQRGVGTAGVQIRGAETQIGIDQRWPGGDHLFELANRLVSLAEIEQREREIVAGLGEAGVSAQRLAGQLDRPLRVLRLTLGLAEQRQELRAAGRLRHATPRAPHAPSPAVPIRDRDSRGSSGPEGWPHSAPRPAPAPLSPRQSSRGSRRCDRRRRGACARRRIPDWWRGSPSARRSPASGDRDGCRRPRQGD